MKYCHILTAFAAEPWAMDREKLAAIVNFMAFKAAGGSFDAEERAARLPKEKSGEIARREGAVAIIPVYGVLAPKMDMMTEISGGTSYSGLKTALHAALSDGEVKAVVLDIDSPGGAVPGAEELAAEIRSLRGGEKPIIAQINFLAASAAYWIASQADEIVVSPSGRAGSIGVYTVHDDLSKALEDKGIKRTYIAEGKFKVEGNEVEPLSADALAFTQARVKRSYDRFVASVAEGRSTTVKDVLANFGQGRTFFAEELVETGMADTIATMDETLARFGADVTPEPIRKIRTASKARAQDVDTMIAKLRAGDRLTKRELEHGLKGLAGLSNSEAERAVRTCFGNGQGEPDEADKAALDAIERALAVARSFRA